MFLILIGLSLSVLYSIFALPTTEGSRPSISPTINGFMYNGMIIIPTDEHYALHVHHWVVYLFLFLLLLMLDKMYILMGFFAGLIVQGLLYKDSFIFSCKNPYRVVSCVKEKGRPPFDWNKTHSQNV